MVWRLWKELLPRKLPNVLPGIYCRFPGSSRKTSPRLCCSWLQIKPGLLPGASLSWMPGCSLVEGIADIEVAQSILLREKGRRHKYEHKGFSFRLRTTAIWYNVAYWGRRAAPL